VVVFKKKRLKKIKKKLGHQSEKNKGKKHWKPTQVSQRTITFKKSCWRSVFYKKNVFIVLKKNKEQNRGRKKVRRRIK